MTDETEEQPESAPKPKIKKLPKVVDRSSMLSGSPKAKVGDIVRKQLDSTAQLKALLGSSALERSRANQSIIASIALAHQPTKQLAELAKLSNPVDHAFRKLADDRRRIFDAFRPKWDTSFVGSALAETMRQIQASKVLNFVDIAKSAHLESVSRLHRDLIESTRVWRERLPSFVEISENIRKLPKRVRENLVALAEAGWYPDSEMPVSDLIEFKQDLADGTPEEVNLSLVEYFRASFDRIEGELVERHPTRARFIKAAFSAHRAGDYSLSIPALFAQADGICLKQTGHQLYTKKGPNKFAKRLDADTFERAYLEPLLRDTPITTSAKRRSPNHTHLNRHAVMHGESVDYDSELNGLKAISFLNFVSYVLTRGDEAIADNNFEPSALEQDV